MSDIIENSLIGNLARFEMPEDQIEFPEHQGELGIIEYYFPGSSDNDPGIIVAWMVSTHTYFWHSAEYWTVIV